MRQKAIEQFADVRIGFAAETAALVLSSRSNAATGIMSNAIFYLTNDIWCSENCYAVHEEKPEHISEATASAGIPSLYINKVKRA